MDDLARWLSSQLDADAARARVASDETEEQWSPGDEHLSDSVNGAESGAPVVIGTYEYLDWSVRQHIAAWDPARVLREIDAKRQLLADIAAERHLVNDGDCWYTCAAATEERDGGETCDDTRHGAPCDCDRDAKVERRLRLFALPYAARDGYRAEWAPTA